MSRIILLTVTLIASIAAYSQTDTTFWFAAPDISSDYNYDRPVMLRITCYSQPSIVTVSQPANGGMPPQTISLTANTTQSIDLTSWLTSIECGPGNIIQNKGLKISSNNKISAYYEVNVNGPNPELFALKGRNALGNQFYISSQYLLRNSSTYNPKPYSSFNIVASEDNSLVTITPTQDITGHSANIPFTITLNKGQTYAAIAASQLASGHLHGSSVISTKPVAITLSDDLLDGAQYGGICADMAGDQTVPVNITGNEYIALKSNLSSPFDKLYITATQNATTITQDGTVVATINAGQSIELSIANSVTYVQTSLPAYAYQLSGYNCEVGSAILPKINCTGSSAVSVTRSTNETFIVTLLIKNGGQNSFLVNGVAGVITSGNFNVVPGTGGLWYYAKVTLSPSSYPNGTVIRISNSISLFQEGVLQGDISGVSFGYFSDYNSVKATALTTTPNPCAGFAIRLSADTVPSASYSWTGPNSFTSSLQNPVINNSTLLNIGTYYLTVNIPDCGTYLDSVYVSVNNCDTNIINTYTPVLTLDFCNNKIGVQDASTFNTGDTVVLIQMKGAVIDSANTNAFGGITNYKNAGNYEFNYVKSKSGNIIELKNTLTKQYDVPIGKVQLIRVPYFQNANITSTLTCLPWDGNKGGVLVLNVQDTVNLTASIDVSGRGFRGGNSPNTGSVTLYCGRNEFTYAKGDLGAAAKGESIYTIGDNIAWGKGSPANGGGGGIGHNSGGGGGANGGAGGLGGYQLLPCGNAPFDNRGIGGHPLTYNSTQNKIFLGGGGGSGHVDNPGGSNMEGGNGGGIIIIRSGKIKSNGFKIIANGNNATQCSFGSFSDCHDGSGGGGAGGTILIENSNYISPIQIDATGGKGGNIIIYNPLAGADKIGPGGGGGGGIVWLNSLSTPANVTRNFNSGTNGVIIANNNDPWGAMPGQIGSGLFNLSIPIATITFKPNIDSLRFKDSSTSCNSYNFKGFGYTNTNPTANWQWYFGDGGTANTQNASHSYVNTGTFTVKLIVTDINGCKDSISKDINSYFLTMDAGPNDTICNATSTVLQATNTGGTIFAWTPALYLNDPTILNPTATPPFTTKFYLTATTAFGCSKTDSVVINVRSVNAFTINPPVSVCKNDSIRLSAGGGDLYVWLPNNSLSNAAISNPNASPLTTTPYTVQITDTLCGNSTTLSTTVTVLQLPTVKANKSNDIDCSTTQSQLNATGAVTYIWSAQSTLSNTRIRNPIATPFVTTQYIVKGTDLSGCENQDSVTVNVTNANKGGYLMPSAFTPNNDGKNDCYGIKYWGIIEEIDFNIYNRWGEQVFHTTKVGDCWNGTYKGVPQDPAIFIYIIRATTTCENSVFRKGTFALIR